MSDRLRQLLAPIGFGAGAGGAVGLIFGACSSVWRMEIGKGLPWLSLATVVEAARAGLAVGAVLAIVGWVLARRAGGSSPETGTRKSSGAAPGVVVGLLGLLALGWIQDALWSTPEAGAGRLVFFLMPVVAFLAALTLVLASSWMTRTMAAGGTRWRRLAVPGLLAAATVLGLAGLEAAHRWVARERPSILLVVVDCLRADRLGLYGYGEATSPVLDRLAGGSLIFERAHSTAAWTKPAVVSILTGLYPARHGAVDPFDVLPRFDATLPELLANAGYRTLFLNGGNTFVSDEFGFDAVFDDYELIDVGGARGVFAALGARLPFLRKRPFFAYLHLMDVHLPYAADSGSSGGSPWKALRDDLQPGRISVGTVRALDSRGELSATEKRLVSKLYDAQVRLVDSQLARLLLALDEAGLGGSTTVILTADHGEELWEHGNFEHGHTLYNEVTRVPLMIFGAGVPPERRAERRQEAASLVDLAPTILGLAGIAPGAMLEGLDLLGPGRELARRDGVFLSGTLYGSEKFAFLSHAGKAIVSTGFSAKKFPLVGPRSFEDREWYAAADAGETESRVFEAPPAAWEKLGEYRDTEGARSEAAEPSASAREKLEALGYLQ